MPDSFPKTSSIFPMPTYLMGAWTSLHKSFDQSTINFLASGLPASAALYQPLFPVGSCSVLKVVILPVDSVLGLEIVSEAVNRSPATVVPMVDEHATNLRHTGSLRSRLSDRVVTVYL